MNKKQTSHKGNALHILCRVPTPALVWERQIQRHRDNHIANRLMQLATIIIQYKHLLNINVL